jgi:hypothetical protein
MASMTSPAANIFDLRHPQPTVKRRSTRAFGVVKRKGDMPLNCAFLEPMTGIEPAYSAWEADVLPLNYIGLFEWHQ